MNGAWICIKLGTAACRGIVHVARWMVAAYMAVHPLPPACDANCHFVIPPAEFAPGGMFAPGAPLASPSPIGESPSPDWGGAPGNSSPSIGPLGEGSPQGSDFVGQGPGAGGPAGGRPVGPTGGGGGSPPGLGNLPPGVTVPPGGGAPPGDAIPEPPTLPLLGVGLIVLGVVRLRRRSLPQ